MPLVKWLSERRVAWFVLAAILLLNGLMLSPELVISRVDLNDNVFHFTLIERMADALSHGENPLDCWSGEWSLGYPVLRTYQPLAHLMVLGGWLASGKSVSLMTVFVWARFLSLVLLPFSFFMAARFLGLRPIACAAAAVLTPMVSTNFLYGLEYGSFTWAGSGLFPQSVAVHFLLFSLGLGYRAIRKGQRLTLAGALLGLTFLAHFIYGYIGALSLCLLAVMPDAEVPRGLRIRRTLWVGAAAGALAVFQVAPLLLDGTINHSRWEFAWKWDSFGPGQVMKNLFEGDLLDYGRLPTLTLLAFCGALWFFWRRHLNHWWGAANQGSGKGGMLVGDGQAHFFILLGAGMWLAIFCGRPLWGSLLPLLGVSRDMQLHRVIGGAHVFLLLLSAVGLTSLGGELGRRRRFGVAALLTALLLYPMAKDRWLNLNNDGTWGRRNLQAYDAERSSLDAALRLVKDRGGRTYPGLAAGWGGTFKIGDVPFHGFLSTAQIPTVSFLYHSMALTSDVMVRFNDQSPDHYRLFNIQTVVAPAEAGPLLPPWVTPVKRIGPFNILAAPGGGYFDMVDVVAAVTTSRNDFYDVNDRWLGSYWVGLRKHLLLDWDGDAPPALGRVGPDDPLPAVAAEAPPGAVVAERHTDEIYEADYRAARDGFALFKMTWHANWKAELDGRAVRTVMLSPGFPAVAMPPGDHHVRFQYRPELWRAAGPFAGILVVILMAMSEKRGLAKAWEAARVVVITVNPDARRRLRIAAGVIALALPVCLPLFSGKVLDGHDAFEYFPRLIEFHQNISAGILLPRWAPDLTNGNGQPLFLFNPPLIYYAGELWHLLGFSFVTALNLACATIVVASAFAGFLLGRLYFGERGGWLASAALIYAPYFALDLYVRSAMAEFAAFPFEVLTLYGFGAYAKHGKYPALLLGAAAYGGVFLSHNGAALLFTPLLVAFIGFTAWRARSGLILGRQAAGLALGLGLGAALWLPSLAERGDIHIDRLLQGYLRYSNHFVYLEQLFYSPWGYGISVEGPKDEMSFALGWSHLLLAGVACVVVARYPKSGDPAYLRFFGVAVAILSFLMLRDAEFAWDRLPLLQYVEFPWRLLGPVAVALALLVAALGHVLDAWPQWRTPAFASAMALLIVPNLSHMAARGLRDVDLSFWTPAALASRGLEVTTAGEYVPRWVDVPSPYDARNAIVVDGDADIQRTARTPVSWSARVVARRPSVIQLAISYYPGWQVRIDGVASEAKPTSGSGQIRFDVPPGDHQVEAQWLRTAPVWLGDGLSLLTLATLVVVWWRPSVAGLSPIPSP
ncbi:MAG TPA: hypothetical protein VKU19_01285 [Bryobacteraceae bacterium]|nr:hypothetical protein [Bryobacteraceae bacterium]